MLAIDVVIPVLLGQFAGLVVCTGDVANLALLALELYVAFADVAGKDRANENTDEEKEYGDYRRLCQLLNVAARDLSVEHCERIVLIAVELETDNLCHSL